VAGSTSGTAAANEASSRRRRAESLRHISALRRDATVAASGNAGGPGFATTVFPFILRAVALVGIDSSQVPIAERRALWQRLGDDLRPNGLGDGVTEVTLDTLPEALDGILAGRARGRWIVRIGG